jgi:hypothetical protein|tara:strand:+ start:373 stop:555 length:183 start_codon:yes stop_codon:yes gene_type:complete
VDRKVEDFVIDRESMNFARVPDRKNPHQTIELGSMISNIEKDFPDNDVANSVREDINPPG